jgi:hypothetical protein
VALGPYAAGLFSNSDDVAAALSQAGLSSQTIEISFLDGAPLFFPMLNHTSPRPRYLDL